MKEKTLRAVGYCRTSGEGQRDNTSIPNQKESIEEFCRRSGWKFLSHYVDESKSGAKVAGRISFQQMLKDAALGKFDLIVPYDVTRFARDGVDILENAKFLRQNFEVHVVDTRGGFDSRPGGNILANYLHAGVSEYERIKIMERTFAGRVRKARNGEPWTAMLPFGRGYDKTTKKWFVTERGHRFRELLERYVAGEGFNSLVTGDFPEFGSSQFVNYIFRRSTLAGPYTTTFEAKELNYRETFTIPQIPEVISIELAQKVRDRMERRRTCNKEDFRKYVLTGYVRCGHCGKFLTGSICKSYTYFRHHSKNAGSPLCVFYGIREDQFAPAVLDYLFRLVTDEPAYNAAIERAFPDPKVREALEHDRAELKSKVTETELEIGRLVNAIAKGVDPALLIGKQSELRERREQELKRLSEVEERLKGMPTKETFEREAMRVRLHLLEKFQNQKWEKLSYEEIRRFLIFVFGENPAKTGDGILVRREGRRWVISFRGRFPLPHDLIDGRPLSHAMRKTAAKHNREVESIAKLMVGNLKSDTDRHETQTPSKSGLPNTPGSFPASLAAL